ncbi:cyanophycin synthetase [Paracoccus isoporae]|uniref:Cyanophycin synthetase n=1 Tax=Paracoccus isoporae TaxID=591205 RepID=A0A1G6WDX6_9RHOB|nr:CapA family protein [Paracoccus isoporae]SDD63285.1 cyanophycin synthetase [Paracoccus isoporae]
MKIAEHQMLLPGNVHTRRRAIRLTLSGAEGLTVPPATVARLRACGDRMRPEITDYPAWRRLLAARGDVPAAGVVEVLALLFQRYCNWPFKYAAWRETATPNHPELPGELARRGQALFETASERVGLAAGRAALDLLGALQGGSTGGALFASFGAALSGMLRKVDAETPSADSMRLIEAAVSRGLPWSVVGRSHYIRIGQGRHAQLLKGTESSNTRSINRAISRDKDVTHRLLDQAGLPVARQHVTSSAKKAAICAADIGYPVVVKPRDGNMGRGVSVGVRDAAELRTAFRRAQAVSRHVVIESVIAGTEYRLLVVNDRFVGAIQRRPAHVTGDGVSTIRRLVARENRRPAREPLLRGSMATLKALKLDRDALRVLRQQGLTPDDVPQDGVEVALRIESNVSRGGEPFDVTDQVHPQNAELAVQTARLIGLDVCGVDFISPDVTVPWQANGAAICEVNSRPGLQIHMHPMGKRGREIPRAILEMLFPKRAPARPPVIALIGLPHETRPLRQRIEAAAGQGGRVLGLCAPGDGSAAFSGSACRLLDDPAALDWDSQIDALLIEITPAQIEAEGLGVERLDLALAAMEETPDQPQRWAVALHRVARDRIAEIDAPDALDRALSVLDLAKAAPDDAASRPAEADDQPVRRRAPREDEFSVLFLGDIGFGESYMNHPRMTELQPVLGRHGHGYSLRHLRGILALPDMTIANLEVPLCGRTDPALQGRKQFLGWCDAQRTAIALKQAGIDAVTLANNHALDCGMQGIAETMGWLDQLGIAGIGAGPDAATASHPLIRRFRVAGRDRALVVFPGFEHRRSYDRRFRWYARGGRGGIAMLSPEAMKDQIAALREVLPDPLFVAFPHWGRDYGEITDTQRDGAAALMAAGIDLIIGHGAHVTQQAARIDGRPVLFNIGNFIWNTPGRFNRRDVLPLGLAVTLNFGAEDRAGDHLRIYPLVIDNDVTRYQNRPVNEAEFRGAADLLGEMLEEELREHHDAAGLYLEMRLAARSGATQDDAVAAE